MTGMKMPRMKKTGLLLRVHGLRKRFGGIHALDGCTFDIPEGKITALIGPNGSGKSTLFNVVGSLVMQEEGRITFAGKDISDMPAHQVARAGISRTFQYPTLFANLTIQDHLEMAILQDDERLLASLLGRRRDCAGRAKEALAMVGLHKPLSTLGAELSYGQRKLLDLAMAVAQPHRLILLDEPVAGINPALRKDIKAILRRLRAKGETLLVIEHDMNFVMDLADHVLVMDEGKILAQGPPKKVRDDPRVLEAYLGD